VSGSLDRLREKSPAQLLALCRHFGLESVARDYSEAMRAFYILNPSYWNASGLFPVADREEVEPLAGGLQLLDANESVLRALTAALPGPSVASAAGPPLGRPTGTGVRVTRGLLLDTFWQLADDAGRPPTQAELRRAIGARLDQADVLDGIPSSTLRATIKREGLEWHARRSWPRH
jgi:hypothetical protein